MQAEFLMMSAGPGCLAILLALLAATSTPKWRTRIPPLRFHDEAGPRLTQKRTLRDV